MTLLEPHDYHQRVGTDAAGDSQLHPKLVDTFQQQQLKPIYAEAYQRESDPTTTFRQLCDGDEGQATLLLATIRRAAAEATPTEGADGKPVFVEVKVGATTVRMSEARFAVEDEPVNIDISVFSFREQINQTLWNQ